MSLMFGGIHSSLRKRAGTVPDRDGLCQGQIAGIQDGPIYKKISNDCVPSFIHDVTNYSV